MHVGKAIDASTIVEYVIPHWMNKIKGPNVRPEISVTVSTRNSVQSTSKKGIKCELTPVTSHERSTMFVYICFDCGDLQICSFANQKWCISRE